MPALDSRGVISGCNSFVERGELVNQWGAFFRISYEDVTLCVSEWSIVFSCIYMYVFFLSFLYTRESTFSTLYTTVRAAELAVRAYVREIIDIPSKIRDIYYKARPIYTKPI